MRSMMLTEGPTVEFKREYTADKIVKTVIAFANTNGGTLYIGVADNGRVIGVSDADATCLKITNLIRDSIEPDIMMFLSCDLDTEDEKIVIKVTVQKGSIRPYCLKNKGPVPSGVFVRQGTSTVQATHMAIRRMIKDSDHEIFEELSSPNQDLTFTETAHSFDIQGLAFDESVKQKLYLQNNEGYYTNLGLWVSDQCTHSVKVAAFRDIQGTDVRSWKEFSGSLLRQLNEVSTFVDLHNNNSIIGMDGLQRVEKWNYPPDAVREALLNAIIHRDYSIRHSTQIKIYPDRIVFMSFGKLLEGQTHETIMTGSIAHRNRKLAELFRRMGFIEAFGFGMPNIMNSYKKYSVKPEITLMETLFIITLPNTDSELKKETLPKQASELSAEIERTILALFTAQEFITREEVERALSVSNRTAKRYLKSLIDGGQIASFGRARSTKYRLKNK